jgi:hypothetical protein
MVRGNTPSRNKIFWAGIVFTGLAVAAVSIPSTSGQELSPGTDLSSIEKNRLMFISNQGIHERVSRDSGSLEIADRKTGETIWRHTDYGNYFDIETVDNSTVMFNAYHPEEQHNYAFFLNWRNKTIVDRVKTPSNTHDVDLLNKTHIMIGDKLNHKISVKNIETGTKNTVYDFKKYYSHENIPGNDFTHLNDVDPYPGNSTVLASPRNFNQVKLINTTTKDDIWSLGKTSNSSVLHRQHNPKIVDRNPATVLVADSENHRIVQYQRTGSGNWNKTFEYKKGLLWPRKAEYLEDSGRMLIVDSNNHRVIKINREGEKVWEYKTYNKFPYDATTYQMSETRIKDMDLFSGKSNVSRSQLKTSGIRLIDWFLPK